MFVILIIKTLVSGFQYSTFDYCGIGLGVSFVTILSVNVIEKVLHAKKTLKINRNLTSAEKSQPEGKRIMSETSFTEFLAWHYPLTRGLSQPMGKSEFSSTAKKTNPVS